MLPVRLSSSILSADFSCLGDQIRQAEQAGVDWIHIDVMDGSFVPNISIGPVIVETCKRISSLPLDVHLMIQHPEQHIQSFANAGANYISIHIENNNNIHRTLQSIRALGCFPGVAINPGTPVSMLDAVLFDIDFILVMTVNPGFSGQTYQPITAKKVKQVRYALDQLCRTDVEIEVDGGITETTIPEVRAYGANIFVAATSIFKYPSGIQAGVAALRKAAG